jgi:hypothetical protein
MIIQKEKLLSISMMIAGGITGFVSSYFLFPGTIDIVMSSSFGAIVFHKLSKTIQTNENPDELPQTIPVKRYTRPRANERD